MSYLGFVFCVFVVVVSLFFVFRFFVFPFHCPHPRALNAVGNWARRGRNMVWVSSPGLHGRSGGRIHDTCLGFLIDFNRAFVFH